MNIAVCDDSRDELSRTLQYVKAYFADKKDITVHIDIYLSSKDVLDKARQNVIYDIYVLDIIMGVISGIELAKTLKSYKNDVKIIFTTTSKDFAVDAFDLKADHYLMKPYTKEKMTEALDRVISSMDQESYLVKNTSSGLKRIAISTIIYSESSGHYQYLHLSSTEVLKIRMKTDELWDELNKFPRFVRPHSGYVVNMDYVKTITSYGLRMENVEIPIAKNSYNKLKETFMDYSFSKIDD